MMDMIDTDKVYKQLDEREGKDINQSSLEIIEEICISLDVICPECPGNYEACNRCYKRQQLIKLCKANKIDVVLEDVIVDE